MENNRKYAIGFVLAILLFFVYRYLSNPLITTVTGTGKVTAEATKASISVTALESADTVSKAEIALKAKVLALRLSMVTNGISEKSLSQSEMQITPLSAVVSGASGYSAQVVITGEIADLSNLSGLVVKLYQSGAGLVTQPVLQVDNQTSMESESLKLAIKDAEKNLKTLSSLKKKLFKKAVNIQQVSSGNASVVSKVETVNDKTVVNVEFAKAVSVTYQLW